MHSPGARVAPGVQLLLGVCASEVRVMARLAPIHMARHRVVAIFYIKAAGITNVPVVVYLHKVGLEWTVDIITTRRAVRSTTSTWDVVSKRGTSAAATVGSTAVPSTTCIATVSTSLVETSRLSRSATSTLLISTGLGNATALITSRLGDASSCVCSESRNMELIDWRWREGGLCGSLSLSIVMRQRCHLLG